MANDLVTAVTSTLVTLVTEANEAAKKHSAATVDTKSLIHEILFDNETTDETILKFRAWHEQANAAILAEESKAAEYAQGTMPKGEEVDTEALKASYTEKKSQVTAAIKLLKTLPGFTEEWLKDVPELKTLRGGTAGTGSGTGGKRPRIANLWIGDAAGNNFQRVYEVKGEGDKATEVSNFTLLAKFLSAKERANTKVEVKDIQAAAFAAAGTDDLKSLDGKVFEFSFSAGKAGEEKNYMVRVAPSVPDSADDEATETAASDETETVVADEVAAE